MSKFQEDELYEIYTELANNPQLNEIFQKKLTITSSVGKYRHRPFPEKYSVSFREAKKEFLEGVKVN
jgi:hypothetical protein